MQGVELELLGIVQVNSQLSAQTLYITFSARNISTWDVGVYQTAAYDPCVLQNSKVLLMRRKPGSSSQGCLFNYSILNFYLLTFILLVQS